MLKAQKILSFSLLFISTIVFIFRFIVLTFNILTYPNILGDAAYILNGISIIGSITIILLMIIFNFTKNKKELFNKKYLIINLFTLFISLSSFLYLFIECLKSLQGF